MEIHIIDWAVWLILSLVFLQTTKHIDNRDRYVVLVILTIVYAIVFMLHNWSDLFMFAIETTTIKM